MRTADEVLASFLAANSQAADGKLSFEELNELMNEHQQKLNNKPLSDFDGLTPEEMTGLLYSPMATGTLLQFREGIETVVGNSPFFKLSELLLNEVVQAGSLKLTMTGSLPVRVCEMLCSQNLINWPYRKYVKKIREEVVPYLWPLQQYLLDEGMVKKRNNTLSLTKNGERLLKESPEVRFRMIFNYLANQFHWCNFYELADDGAYGKMGWAYSLLLLAKYGDSPRESNFYSLKVMQAFETHLWEAHKEGLELKDIDIFNHAYSVRFFENFAEWFGLVNIERKTDPIITYRSQLIITRSKIFDQLFEVNPNG
jgi:hypothetical protein